MGIDDSNAQNLDELKIFKLKTEIKDDVKKYIEDEIKKIDGSNRKNNIVTGVTVSVLFAIFGITSFVQLPDKINNIFDARIRDLGEENIQQKLEYIKNAKTEAETNLNGIRNNHRSIVDALKNDEIFRRSIQGKDANQDAIVLELITKHNNLFDNDAIVNRLRADTAFSDAIVNRLKADTGFQTTIKGENGVSIQSADIDNNTGHLILHLSNSIQLDAGKVRN